MSAEQTTAPVENVAPVETAADPAAPAEPAAQAPEATNQEELMKLVIDQENELGSTKTALEKAHAELMKMQNAWKEREDNERLQTKSKAEALSKALVDSWSASLPADMMTDENPDNAANRLGFLSRTLFMELEVLAASNEKGLAAGATLAEAACTTERVSGATRRFFVTMSITRDSS